jgi:PIN domain nuclease of toxin-antitoxin system
MKYLLDTQVLLWAASAPDKLSEKWRECLADRQNDLIYSAASFWEIATKKSMEHPNFKVDMWHLRRCLQDNEYEELPVTSEHICFTLALEKLHQDPFDRILIAQACVDDLILITADRQVAQYPGPIEMIG